MELRSLKELQHRRKKLARLIARGLRGHEIPLVAEMEAFMLEEAERELQDIDNEIKERFVTDPQSSAPQTGRQSWRCE